MNTSPPAFILCLGELFRSIVMKIFDWTKECLLISITITHIHSEREAHTKQSQYCIFFPQRMPKINIFVSLKRQKVACLAWQKWSDLEEMHAWHQCSCVPATAKEQMKPRESIIYICVISVCQFMDSGTNERNHWDEIPSRAEYTLCKKKKKLLMSPV